MFVCRLNTINSLIGYLRSFCVIGPCVTICAKRGANWRMLTSVLVCSRVCFAFLYCRLYAFAFVAFIAFVQRAACANLHHAVFPDMRVPDMRIFSTRNRHIFQTNLFL